MRGAEGWGVRLWGRWLDVEDCSGVYWWLREGSEEWGEGVGSGWIASYSSVWMRVCEEEMHRF